MYLAVILQCVQVNQTTKPYMSVSQEKLESVVSPVAIQSVRIPSKFITKTGKKADDQAQLGYTKGSIFIWVRAISFVFPFHDSQGKMYLHKNMQTF